MKKARTRKIITCAIVFLLAGAIINVAVAWGLAAFSPLGQYHESYEILTFDQATNWGMRLGVAIGLTQQEASLRKEQSYFRPRTHETHLISSVGFRRIRVLLDPAGLVWSELRTGLPGESLRSTWRNGEENGIAIRPPHWTAAQDEVSFMWWPRRLPINPIWPGFAINTVFYAAILWVLFAVPGAIRHAVRHRRGLCPACAYPIGASDTCTECGMPVRTA